MVVKGISKNDPSTEVEEQRKSRQQITIKASESDKQKLISKMVEAMVERTPEFLRQFAKQYRYFICPS